MSRVTFVGVGAIGLPMALRLHEAGHAVTAVDPFERQRELAQELGMAAAGDTQSVHDAEVVIVMVATPAQLEEALLGEQGILARQGADTVTVVMSTVGPGAIAAVEPHAAELGAKLLDVPVTGGVSGAKRGALTLFASGPSELIDSVRDVLSVLGTVRNCGEKLGSGQSLKLVNQLLCSVHIVAAAEALAFAEKLGLDPREALEAVEGGAAASWMLSDRGPRMLHGLDAEVTSTIGIFVKDSGLVADAALAAGASAPLLEVAHDAYRRMAEAGYDRVDDSQVIQTYRDGVRPA